MKELSSLRPPEGANRARKRLGRGTGTGLGKTAGRGHKGQRARKSGNVSAGFEGGQTPMQRRLPKFGFTNIFRTNWATVNVSEFARFEAGETVDEIALRRHGLVKGANDGVKILGDGDLDRALNVVAHKFTAGAADKIRAAGGTVTIIGEEVVGG
jgi:large subunit ribosomal protein L15